MVIIVDRLSLVTFCLSTNWVGLLPIFGSNFLEISGDFADLGGKTGKYPGKCREGIYLKVLRYLWL